LAGRPVAAPRLPSTSAVCA